MKAVLISIQPKYVKLIMDGSKTIEVRKSYPKQLKTPFKCYLYCTSKKPYLYKNPNNGELFFDSDEYRGGDYEDRFLSRKVVGEFVCDKVEQFTVGSIGCDTIQEKAWLSYTDMINYFYKPNELGHAIKKFGYGWHISDLKIYDKPKELGEFGFGRAPQSWCYEEVQE